MNLNKETYKKIFALITYTMILLFIMYNIKDIFEIVWTGLKMLLPLWIGIALAFTLNVPMSIIENNVFKKKTKCSRIISLLCSIAIIVVIIITLFVWVIPDFIDSITYLLNQIPSLIEGLNNLLLETFKNTELSDYIKNFSGSTEIGTILSSLISSLINNFTNTLSNFVTLVINLVTGIIISIYFLLEKEHILKQVARIINKILPEKTKEKYIEVYELANKSFHDFITYQCLECFVLGTMMFIALSIFQLPYALTIAFLTCITAIVPIFGATIACVVGAVLIGTVSIKQAIIFLIVFQVVQQFENNVIYPRVVGTHVGLPPIITIIAIIVGGNVAGFFGMIICIPLTSVLYSLFWTKINEIEKKEKKEAKKNKQKEEKTTKKPIKRPRTKKA